MPTNADLDAAYSGFYRPASGRFGSIGDGLLRRTRGLLAGRIDTIAPPGPVLDVGSGDGALLDALAAVGRDPTGLERESERPDVTAEPLTEQPPGWAAIVFWHSLEHFPNPATEIGAAVARLAPGGALVVAVPNFASLQASALGPRWLALDWPRHLVHLRADALLTGLSDAGLTVERVSHWRGGQGVFGWLHGLASFVPGGGDLYDAIRSAPARSRPLSPARRAWTLLAGALLLPVAAALGAIEAAAGRGGSVYVEARRAALAPPLNR